LRKKKEKKKKEKKKKKHRIQEDQRKARNGGQCTVKALRGRGSWAIYELNSTANEIGGPFFFLFFYFLFFYFFFFILLRHYFIPNTRFLLFYFVVFLTIGLVWVENYLMKNYLLGVEMLSRSLCRLVNLEYAPP